MVGSTAVLSGELLVLVTAAPYTGGVIRCVADEPDIVVVAGGTALAGCRHVRQGCAGAGGADADTGACEDAVGLHGILHGISQQERGGILQNPVGFRLIVDEQLAIVIQDLCEEYRFGVKAAVGNGSKGSGQFQVGHTQLRTYGFHHGAHSNDVHGVDDTVADVGVTQVTLLIPVFKGLGAHGERGIVVNASQGGTAGVQSRGKCSNDLESRTRLSGSVGSAV